MPAQPVSSFHRASWRAQFFRGMLIVLLVALLSGCFGSLAAVSAYVYVARQLPPAEQLVVRSKSFESTRIYDRNGRLLWEIMDPSGGRRTVVSLSQVPLVVRQATIATEDPTFYSNPGVNPLSIARAFYQNYREGEITSGASTITQQVVKNTFLSPEVSYTRKVKEAVLATEVARRYSKDEILQIYLNQTYYGNMAYGIGTAAEVYFQKDVSKLTLAEGAMIVGMAQGPALYDPYTNLARAKIRQGIVLDLMVKRGYLARSEADAAKAEPLSFTPPAITMKAPHFSVFVREQLEAQYGTELLYRSGMKVTTTLDLALQEKAEAIVQSRLALLKEGNATNAAVLVMDPQTGQILAMVGSADFFDDKIDGQVNVTMRPRQPGSSIKPVTYLAAFERGWTASTMIMDITTEFPDGANPPYVPKNHDNLEHGPVLVRGALARSLNIPAVKALQYVTLPAFLEMAHRLGITSLTRPDYGLALTLGGGDVTLMEMTGLYAELANGGRRVRPEPILRIVDSSNRVLYQAPRRLGEQLIDERYAYIITSILSDNAARAPTFGVQNSLVLSRPAAAKTGTTDDYRDAWTIGYTPQVVTGVWVGNSDGTKMNAVFGSRGAAPIWHEVMEEALKGLPVVDWQQPPHMTTVEICPISGKLRTDKCPPGHKEIYLSGTEPTTPCDVHVDVAICSVSGARATQYCPANVLMYQYYEVYPPEYRSWAEKKGIPQPPLDTCGVHIRAPLVELVMPRDGDYVLDVVDVRGSARIDDFDHYELQYGIGDSPVGWGVINWQPVAVENGLLLQWDTRLLLNGMYSLRVVAFDRHGNVAQSPAIRVIVQNPEPTATPTATRTSTATPTPTPTLTPTATRTMWVTVTPEVTATATRTPWPTATPWPSPTRTAVPTVPADTPTPEPTVTPLPTNTAVPPEPSAMRALAICMPAPEVSSVGSSHTRMRLVRKSPSDVFMKYQTGTIKSTATQIMPTISL